MAAERTGHGYLARTQRHPWNATFEWEDHHGPIRQLSPAEAQQLVRKAYILQYCPSDAAVLEGDPRAGAPTRRVSCTAADRQYEVLRGDHPVPAA